ncbi:ATP-binding cassette domain-containing protein [Ferribacterium limneticum]|uniref:ATP-binding cassette domain-containing protein n=1 Tax=Ferribacterium limneticum TaxID=76259 RepID=UPI001CF7F420|nr:ATP-binding cassette domain-containing protein [Ferribacterium limneticum]UCV23633.1 ABC transporter ATP-binding protein [Ferribacterium limneticum]
MGFTTMVDDAEPIVRVLNFVKRYRQHLAVDSVSLTLECGEIYGLIGPDGAGKSSLMKAVAGVLSFEGGSLHVLGEKIDSESAAESVKGRLGFMPQGLGLNLYPELSVEENIDFFAELRAVSSVELARRKQKLLDMTRLGPFRGRPMKQLSGGMKQKLGLVCTLIHEPELIILDEPTTGVDPVSRRDFWMILTQLLRERGITALVSTAYLDEAMRFHRLALMYDGRILVEGEPDVILREVPGTLVELVAEPQVEALLRLKARFIQAEVVGRRLRVFVPDGEPETARAQVAAHLVGVQVRDIQTSSPDLEDAFIALLHKRQLTTSDGVPQTNIWHDGEPSKGDGVAIAAGELTHDFDQFRAVDHASFEVRQGEIFGLLGANGAGKTTVIKMLTGILPPTSGAGTVAGSDMRNASQAIKEHIGYVSQAFSLYQDMTVQENLRLFARIYGVPGSRLVERIDRVVALAGLSGITSHLVSKLPMGIRQRLALACALVHGPRVLFLDEPTSGVDPIGRRRFWEILVHLARVEQVAILITTHYMNEAEHCDHLALMHAGRVIADDTPAALKTTLQQQAGQVLDIAAEPVLAALEALEQAGFANASLFGKRIHLLARDVTAVEVRIRTLFAERGIRLFDIVPRTPSLEDVFVHRILQQEMTAST